MKNEKVKTGSKPKILSINEFLKFLSTARETDFDLYGMAKLSNDKDSFLFSLGRNCINWTRVPCAAVESIELLEIAPCHDHTHPFIHLQLKRDSSTATSVWASIARGAMSGVGKGSHLHHRLAAGPVPFNPARAQSPVPHGWQCVYAAGCISGCAWYDPWSGRQVCSNCCNPA